MNYIKIVSLPLLLACLFLSQAANAYSIRSSINDIDVFVGMSQSPPQQNAGRSQSRNDGRSRQATPKRSDLHRNPDSDRWWTDPPLWSGANVWRSEAWSQAGSEQRQGSGSRQTNPGQGVSWWMEDGKDLRDTFDISRVYGGQRFFRGSGLDQRDNNAFVREFGRNFVLGWKLHWLFQEQSAASPAVVPVPAAAWLMASGLGLLGLFRRKRILK